MHDTEARLSSQSDTIRRLHGERDAALIEADKAHCRADRAETKLRDERKAHYAQLNGDWTDANPVVRELRNDVDWDKLGLELVICGGKGWIKRADGDPTDLSLCASSPGEVLAWVDGFDTAMRSPAVERAP